MRTEHTIGVYTEHYAMILKWYSLAFKDKHPSKKDEEAYNLFKVIYEDNLRDDEETKDDE